MSELQRYLDEFDKLDASSKASKQEEDFRGRVVDGKTAGSPLSKLTE